MKNVKAVGLDNLETKFMKLMNKGRIKRINNIFNNIYDTGYIPKEWLKSEFITLPRIVT